MQRLLLIRGLHGEPHRLVHPAWHDGELVLHALPFGLLRQVCEVADEIIALSRSSSP
jgi:hypothetical protein